MAPVHADAGAAGTPAAHERRESPLTLTVEQAARALGISRTLAYEAVARDEIPHLKVGRRLLIPRAALDRLLLGAA